MLASFKPLLATLCLFSTVLLYGRNSCSCSRSCHDDALAHSYAKKQRPLNPFPYEDGAAIPISDKVTTQDRTSKILQASMMFGHNYKGLNERTLQSHADHATRWGYGNHVLRREIVGAGEIEGEGDWNKFIFSKLLYILKIMIAEMDKPRDKRAEWIVWYDADTLILNPNIPWSIFLPPPSNPASTSIKILATKDVSGFNAGMFFCRVDEWVIDVLADAYALPRLNPDIEIAGNIEQNALKHIFNKPENKRHVVYQPTTWYNWYSDKGLFSNKERPDRDVQGDMVIHFCGINHNGNLREKKDVMDTMFGKMKSDPSAWNVPLENTRYPEEVAAFWELYNQARDTLEGVEHRDDLDAIEYRWISRIAMRELKWAVEEEPYDARNLNRTLQTMVKALRGFDQPNKFNEQKPAHRSHQGGRDRHS